MSSMCSSRKSYCSRIRFLNPKIVVWLGESIHSKRHREYDELAYIENTLETSGVLLRSPALMSDAMIIEKADIKTLKKMKEDYEKLL
jgi:triphosphoribosyl-dephospho-CoA synthetase